MAQTLRLTSPYIGFPHGDGTIKSLQHRLNNYSHRELHDLLPHLDEDGQYGPMTDSNTRQVLYLMGIGRGPRREPIKSWMVQIILHPERRAPQQHIRSGQRIKTFLEHPDKAGAVIRWCATKEGITESPPGSNRGPQISQWQRTFGMDGQPWCGAFVGDPLKHVAGLPIPNGIVYTPNIIHYAQSGQGGFASWHGWPDRKPGDLVLFKWPGISRDLCDHVGILDLDGNHTIEGNTSSGDGGSQNNGGGVFRRDRRGSNVVGCARPRY